MSTPPPTPPNQPPPPPGGGQPPYGGQPPSGSQPPYGGQPGGSSSPYPQQPASPYGSPQIGGGQPPFGSAPPPPSGPYGGGPMGPGGAKPYSPIDAITYGWKKFTENVGTFLLLGVLWIVCVVGVQFIFNLMGGGLELSSTSPFDPDTPTPGAQAGSLLLQTIGSLLSSLLGWIVGLMLIRAALDAVDTGRADLSETMGRIPWGQALLAGLLVGLAALIGLVALCVGAFVVMFFTYYTNVAVVDGRSAVDAVRASFDFVKDNLADNLVLLLLGIVGMVLTICTCYLGGMVVMPVLSIAIAYTWRVLQGRPAVP